MNSKDAIYYCGLIAGLIAGTLLARLYTDNNLLQLGAGVVLGVALGYTAERVFGPPK